MTDLYNYLILEGKTIKDLGLDPELLKRFIDEWVLSEDGYNPDRKSDPWRIRKTPIKHRSSWRSRKQRASGKMVTDSHFYCLCSADRPEKSRLLRKEIRSSYAALYPIPESLHNSGLPLPGSPPQI